MKRRMLSIAAVVLSAGALCLWLPSRTMSAQNADAQDAAAVSGPIYDPYPPGILPADLGSEIRRVLREADVLERRAFLRWQALTPPTLTGQPPTLKGTGTEAMETLGELMNYDRRMSPKRDQACSSCHMPYAGFSGPIPSVNLTMIAYPGTIHFRANKRTAQRYTYAPFFPVLQFNQALGLPFGGNFWDSRSTGFQLRNPDAEQAQHPPVDTGEMGFPDTACIAFRLSHSRYRDLFEQVWGEGSLDINFPPDTEQICSTPGGAAIFAGNTTPIQLSPADRTLANQVYNHWGQSLDAYEQSIQVSAFTSKFDAMLAGNYTFTANETAGYKLFNGKGNCNSCHLDAQGTALAPGQTDTSSIPGGAPVFTCFGSANEGLPLNPRVAYYYETKPDPYGYVVNPLGFSYRDLGMGTFLRSGFGSAPNPNDNWTSQAPNVDGQMQVSSARNVAMTPSKCPTTEAPGPYFQKEFFHNGYIKSLKQLVHFYNTRDVPGIGLREITSGHCPAGTIERVTCWPRPEEDLIVTFLQTLTDGYTIPYPNSDTYTGTCMKGGSASTQGNESIIPTPKLPPCATEICGVPPLPTMPIP
jgi:cytochrome c peroxidase